MPAFLVPKKLASQLLALLVTALLVAFSIAAGVSINAQRLNDRSTRDRMAADRVYELITTVEALSPSKRQQFAKTARTKTTSIKIEMQPAVLFTAENDRSKLLATRVMQAVQRVDIRASVLSRSGFDDAGDAREAGRNREVIALSVPLHPAGWLNFNSREPLTWYTREEKRFLVLVFALSILLVTGVAWFFVRRLIRPVEAIAIAAGRVANGDRSARIPIVGPTEFREAATAFNSMQRQIGRFELERTRTVAAVGHDLRTPITSLRVRAEMIENKELREPMISTLEEITAMANGLISYARSRSYEEFVDELDLHSLLDSIVSQYDASFQSFAKPKINGGSLSLSRAFRNLLDNAARYAEQVSVTLATEDNRALVCFLDEGPGIPPELIDSIMAPFVRGEQSRNTETGGSGLGLTIASEIIQSHGGDLVLNNREHKGLCVRVMLPLYSVSSDTT